MNTNKRILITHNHTVYLCVLLSCMVPRAGHTLKLHLGIDFSYYTIAVVFIWLLSIRRITIKRKTEYTFFVIWAAFIVLSVWRAEKIGVWAAYVDWIFTGILFQQIIIRNRDDKTYEYIIKAFNDALFIHLLIGMYEITTHRYLFEVAINSKAQYGHVPISIFRNLNDYATFVTTMFPFTIYRFFGSRKMHTKIYCIILAIVSLYLIVVSQSRAAILTLVAFVCAGVFMFARKSPRNKLIFAGGLFFLAMVVITDTGGIQTILLSFIRKNWINVDGYSDYARLNLIKNGLYFLKRTYGFGVGAGNLYNWLAEKSIYEIGHLRFIHNWYVEVVVTFGVLFFAIYLYFHGKVLYRLFTKKLGTTRLKTAFFQSFVCFSIVSISSSSNVYSEWVWMYLVVLGVFSSSLKRTGLVSTLRTDPLLNERIDQLG